MENFICNQHGERYNVIWVL